MLKHNTSLRGSTLTETALPQAPREAFAWTVLWQEVLIRNKELISCHQQGEFRKGQKVTPGVQPPPRIPHWYPSWLSKVWTTKKDAESEWLAKDNPETNPITMKPEAVATWQSSPPGFPYPTTLQLRGPFPIKSLALPAHLSPWTIHFWVLDKSPLLDPKRGSSSCNISWNELNFLKSMKIILLLEGRKTFLSKEKWLKESKNRYIWAN